MLCADKNYADNIRIAHASPAAGDGALPDGACSARPLTRSPVAASTLRGRHLPEHHCSAIAVCCSRQRWMEFINAYRLLITGPMTWSGSFHVAASWLLSVTDHGDCTIAAASRTVLSGAPRSAAICCSASASPGQVARRRSAYTAHRGRMDSSPPDTAGEQDRRNHRQRCVTGSSVWLRRRRRPARIEYIARPSAGRAQCIRPAGSLSSPEKESHPSPQALLSRRISRDQNFPALYLTRQPVAALRPCSGNYNVREQDHTMTYQSVCSRSPGCCERIDSAEQVRPRYRKISAAADFVGSRNMLRSQ